MTERNDDPILGAASEAMRKAAEAELAAAADDPLMAAMRADVARQRGDGEPVETSDPEDPAYQAMKLSAMQQGLYRGPDRPRGRRLLPSPTNPTNRGHRRAGGLPGSPRRAG